ncbi:MAG: hypothetical protein FWH18_06125 [Marinilabiliaceae bacterium]|nr:hypothetical protein [Marinilabiliaceae bacterium]
MDKRIIIPAGRLANDDAAAKRRREELREKLLSGKKIPISPEGSVTKLSENGGGITIPSGKLAIDDAAAKRRREELRDKLLSGKKIPINREGSVINPSEGGGITIPSGKLAIAQWYEKDPSLLIAEKAAMTHAFPHFELEKLDDGRLAWTGSLNVGVMGDSSWYIMAVYNNNHPQQIMGSSVRVYLVEPDINDLIKDLGWKPAHLLIDSDNQLYLCTAEAGNIKTGKEVTSAASVIAWAVKWLMAFELVLMGDLSVEKFNEHGGL